MTNETNVSDQFARRIGSKNKRDYNFMRESQLAEMEDNYKTVILHRKNDRGIETIDLILEPNKFDELSSKVRLSFDEYCEVINQLIDEEEAEWDELRMKDQVNITRDAILQSTMLKYASTEYGIKKEDYSGTDINYLKRYDAEGRFLGEATMLTLTRIPMMDVKK
jgi:hypothetical protein